jgi:hypothetical protein
MTGTQQITCRGIAKYLRHEWPNVDDGQVTVLLKQYLLEQEQLLDRVKRDQEYALQVENDVTSRLMIGDDLTDAGKKPSTIVACQSANALGTQRDAIPSMCALKLHRLAPTASSS